MSDLLFDRAGPSPIASDDAGISRGVARRLRAGPRLGGGTQGLRLRVSARANSPDRGANQAGPWGFFFAVTIASPTLSSLAPM